MAALAQDTTTTTLLDLPPSTLAHILSLIPLPERLGSCLVCSSFRDAAAAGTTAISRESLSTTQDDDHPCRHMLQWVCERAACVTMLQLGHTLAPPHAAALPWCEDVLLSAHFQGLQRLHLTNMALEHQQHQPHSINTALTELHICSCSMETMEGLAVLAALPRLQRLRLSVLVPTLQQSAHPQPQWRLPGSSTWAQLSAALTHLDLSGQHNVTDSALQDISCSLTGLRELHVRAEALTAGGLSVLQSLQQLSTLDLQLCPQIAFSCSSTPVLPQLPRLRRWQLFCWKGELDAALLASLSRLHHLQLRAWSKRSRPEALSALLSAVGQLTALTALELVDVLQQADPGAMPLGSAPFRELAASSGGTLTASSRLRMLCITGAELPDGAWPHVFRGSALPLLRQLSLSDVTPSLSESDLQLAVRCCPNLTGLTLLRSLQSGATLAPLLPLAGCLRELHLRHVHGDSGARVLAQFTSLQRLHNDDANVSPAGLMWLTALRSLTSLHLHYSPMAWSWPRPVSLTNKVGRVLAFGAVG